MSQVIHVIEQTEEVKKTNFHIGFRRRRSKVGSGGTFGSRRNPGNPADCQVGDSGASHEIPQPPPSDIDHREGPRETREEAEVAHRLRKLRRHHGGRHKLCGGERAFAQETEGKKRENEIGGPVEKTERCPAESTRPDTHPANETETG